MAEFFTLSNLFLYPAIFWFFLYGIGAPREVFGAMKQQKTWDEFKKLRPSKKWWIYQFVFNGVGAFAGWVALYFLCRNTYTTTSLSIEHFAEFAIAFYGITGNLPQVSLLLRRVPGLP